MHKYKPLGKKGEGTFSEVLKAQDTKTGRYVAIKCMKNHFDNVEQVNRLREIQALRRLSPHPNIIKLYEVLFDRTTGRLALVFELMDANIYDMIRGRRQYIAEEKVLHYMYQLMKSVDHMHRNGIFHRDIKPENILVCGDALKLADFGSCRGIYSKQPFTEYISTRWYRAPECLLTDGYYNYKMDMWGIGCVFFEILSLYPLFPGSNEIDQINKIHNVLGTPPSELLAKFQRQSTHLDYDFPIKVGVGITKFLPHVSPDALDLMLKLLTYNPEDRISAKQALRHAYFREIRDLDKKLRKQRMMDRNSLTLNTGSSLLDVSAGSAIHDTSSKEDVSACTITDPSHVLTKNTSTRLPIIPVNQSSNATSMNLQNSKGLYQHHNLAPSFSLTTTNVVNSKKVKSIGSSLQSSSMNKSNEEGSGSTIPYVGRNVTHQSNSHLSGMLSTLSHSGANVYSGLRREGATVAHSNAPQITATYGSTSKLIPLYKK